MTTKAIQELIPTKSLNSSISVSRVARHFWVVSEKASIQDVANEFSDNPQILVLGVVTEDLRPLGILTRDQIFQVLSLPFRKELLGHKPILRLLQTTGEFPYTENIFSLAERLGPEIDRSVLTYYLLTHEGRFFGIFSSQDLLLHLSQITQKDINLAASLQDRILNHVSVFEEELTTIRSYGQSAKGLGGDFYYTQELSDGRWFMTLCDVSGKGVAASIITAILWGMIKMFNFKKGIGQLIREINKALIQTFQLEKYLTGVFLVYDPQTREMTVADMGHSFLFLFRQGRSKHIGGIQTNLPIGIEPHLSPKLFRIRLKEHDSVVLFTDGFIEQINPEGQEWGIQGFLDSFKKNPQEVIGDFHRFRRQVPQQDDCSYLILESHTKKKKKSRTD